MLVDIPPRPNRLEPGPNGKDAAYHCQYARWAIGNFNIYQYQNFVSQYLTNAAFYKGEQWIFEEDLEAFLTDESGEMRNRIKWVHNVVKPFVEYFRGSAIKMDLNSEVVSISRESKNRRDKALDNLLYWSRLAQKMQQQNPQVAQQIQQQMQVPPNPDSVSATFKNLYIDEYTRNVNYLRKYIAEVKNDVMSYKPRMAEDIALSGIGVLRNTARNEEQVWTRTAPERFIFDTTSEYQDLRDAEFMGEFEMRSAVDMFEEYQNLDDETRERIEQSSLANTVGLHNVITFYINYAQKLPSYRMYWRDIEVTEHGAFMDEYGYPMLQEINAEHPKNELIPVKDLAQFADDYEWIRTILNKDEVDGKKKLTKNRAIVPTDCCRYCDFIPGEFINSGMGGGTGGTADIVLSYGILPYTQKYSYRHEWVEYPYCAWAYSLLMGEITAPITTLISPQRYLNRVLSVAESHVNNARGSGTIFDKDTIDPQGGEEEIQRNINLSKPIFVNGQRQLNNAVGSYDNTIKQGTLSLYDIAERMKTMADQNIGGGANLTGGVDAYRASASGMNQNITQAVAMQEPFFYGIEQIYHRAFNSMVNRGKRIYCSNSRELALEIGDEGVALFKLSADYDLEEFRCRVVRMADRFTEKDAANQMLMQFYQLKMIDQQAYSKYFGRADLSMSDVAYCLREFTGLQAEAAEKQAQQQPQVDKANMQQTMAANEMQHNQQMEMQDRGFNQDSALQASKNQTQVTTAAISALGKAKNEKQETK